MLGGRPSRAKLGALAALISMLAAVFTLALSPDQADAQAMPVVSLSSGGTDVGALYSDPWSELVGFTLHDGTVHQARRAKAGQITVQRGREFTVTLTLANPQVGTEIIRVTAPTDPSFGQRKNQAPPVHKIGIVKVGDDPRFSRPQRQQFVSITTTSTPGATESDPPIITPETVNIVFRVVSDGSALDTNVRIKFEPQRWGTAKYIPVTIKRQPHAASVSATPSCGAGGGCLDITEGLSMAYMLSLAEQPGSGQTVTVTPREAQVATSILVCTTDRPDDPFKRCSRQPVPFVPKGLTFSPASVSFTSSDWQTAKTVTVTAPQDGDVLHEKFKIVHDYSGVSGSAAAPPPPSTGISRTTTGCGRSSRIPTAT